MMVCSATVKRILTIALILAAAITAAPAYASPAVSSPTPHYRRVGSGEDAYYEIDYYTVSSAAQLRGLAGLLSPEGPVYLTCDIWLNPDENPTEEEFTPIGSENRAFVGTFDGQGHTIHNLYVNQPDRDCTGLFGKVSGAIVNLTVTGTVTGHTDTGGVAGYLDRGSISNVTSEVTVNGYLEVGGIVGYAGGSVTNSTNRGDVKATYGAGGVAGSSASAMTGCVNYGNIAVTETAAGGVTSASSGTITDCTNHGSVSSTQQSGGVVGALNGTVSNCVNYGTITGDFFIGGISSRIYTGGEINGCYNYGSVDARNMAGGVTGYNDEGTIDNCHNRKDITANIVVAGIAGYNKGTITNCTSTGKITSLAEEYTGGIAGENDGQIEDSYFEEGSADLTTGSPDSSSGSETGSGVQDDVWFDEFYPADKEPGAADNPDSPGGDDGSKTDVVLSQDTIIEENETYPVDWNTNLVIPGGVTLTDKGILDNDGSVTVKDQGTLIIDITGAITGDGVVIVENGGKVINNSDSPVTVVTDDGTNETVSPGETYQPGETSVGGKDTTLETDTTIPEGEIYPVAPDETLTVPSDVTLTVEGEIENEGQIVVEDNGTVIIDDTGAITGDGVVIVENGGKVINNSDSPVTVVTDDGTNETVSPGETYQPGETSVGGKDTTLETDTTIPEGEIYPVAPDETLTVPSDVTLTVEGEIDNEGQIAVEDNGTVIIEDTGSITDGGTITVDDGGTIINNSGQTITVTDGNGSPQTIHPGESFTGGGSQTEIQPDKILETDTTIPEGEIYPVSPDESLVIPGDVTLIVEGTLNNDGTVTVQDGGTINVTETGNITGGGIIVVQPGGTIINGGNTSITIVTDGGGTSIILSGETHTEQPQLYVTAQAETGGSISPSGRISVAYGGSVAFTVSPQSGYEIDTVAVNGISIGAVSSYTMTDIKESATIQAFFKQTDTGGTYVSSGGGSGCNATHASAALLPCAALFIVKLAQRKKNNR